MQASLFVALRAALKISKGPVLALIFYRIAFQSIIRNILLAAPHIGAVMLVAIAFVRATGLGVKGSIP